MQALHAAPTPKTFDLKLIQIGNSQGLRLARPLLRQFGITHSVTAEIRSDGILLRSAQGGKLSLDDTFAQMALEQTNAAYSPHTTENWAAFDITSADGLEQLPW